jgi:hypothetical protein
MLHEQLADCPMPPGTSDGSVLIVDLLSAAAADGLASGPSAAAAHVTLCGRHTLGSPACDAALPTPVLAVDHAAAAGLLATSGGDGCVRLWDLR